MTINEIANDILKKEDNQLARAFTMVIGSLLISKGIQPIINKSERCYDENDDLNKYIIRTEYNVTFDIDTSDHDKQVRDEVIEEFAEWLVSEGILGNRVVANGEITDYGKVYAKQFKEQMKEEQNE